MQSTQHQTVSPPMHIMPSLEYTYIHSVLIHCDDGKMRCVRNLVLLPLLFIYRYSSLYTIYMCFVCFGWIFYLSKFKATTKRHLSSIYDNNNNQREREKKETTNQLKNTDSRIFPVNGCFATSLYVTFCTHSPMHWMKMRLKQCKGVTVNREGERWKNSLTSNSKRIHKDVVFESLFSTFAAYIFLFLIFIADNERVVVL